MKYFLVLSIAFFGMNIVHAGSNGSGTLNGGQEPAGNGGGTMGGGGGGGVLDTAVSRTITMNCEVIDSTLPTNWPKSFLEINLKDSLVDSVELKQFTQNNNGEFDMLNETVFSVKALNRGGFKITECIDENIASIEQGIVRSTCGKLQNESLDQLEFRFEYSKSSSGHLFAQASEKNTFNTISRQFSFSECGPSNR